MGLRLFPRLAPRCSRALHERIPHSEFVVIADAVRGHVLEAPQRFNETCLGFLQRRGFRH